MTTPRHTHAGGEKEKETAKETAKAESEKAADRAAERTATESAKDSAKDPAGTPATAPAGTPPGTPTPGEGEGMPGGNIPVDKPGPEGQHVTGAPSREDDGRKGGPRTLPPAGPGRPAVPVREADHGHAQQSREAAERDEAQRTEERQKRRRRIKAGNVGGGEWALIGGSLLNMSALTRIQLPTEGADPFVLTITSISGDRVTISGDEAKDFMKEWNLEAIPAEIANVNSVTQEGGRKVSARDLAAEGGPRTVVSAPARNPVGATGGNLPQPPTPTISEDARIGVTPPAHPDHTPPVEVDDEDDDGDEDEQSRAGPADFSTPRDKTPKKSKRGKK